MHELKYFIIKDLNTPLDRLIENRKHKCKNWAGNFRMVDIGINA